MAALLRVPGGVEPVAIDCACDDDAYSARIRRSLDNLRALGAPEAVIAHHEGILTATCAENARLQPREEIAMPHANVKADWHDIEEQTAFVPSGDGLDAARGIGWAVVLEGALLLALLGLVLLVGAVTHDSTGRVRAAVQEAQ